MSESLMSQLQKVVDLSICDKVTEKRYVQRIKQGDYTIDENSESHFVVAFALYDPDKEKVFIGHHKKSGLWLFSGGHINKGELLQDTVRREIEEEWGKGFSAEFVNEPFLWTVTEIDNPGNLNCREHFDVWYLIPVNSETFVPDKSKLAIEFHEAGWKTFSEARSLITVPSYLLPIDKIERLLDK